MRAVLGAARVAAQKERRLIKQTHDEMVKPLQEQIKTLQSQLSAERNSTQRLHTLSQMHWTENKLHGLNERKGDKNLLIRQILILFWIVCWDLQDWHGWPRNRAQDLCTCLRSWKWTEKYFTPRMREL